MSIGNIQNQASTSPLKDTVLSIGIASSEITAIASPILALIGAAALFAIASPIALPASIALITTGLLISAVAFAAFHILAYLKSNTPQTEETVSTKISSSSQTQPSTTEMNKEGELTTLAQSFKDKIGVNKNLLNTPEIQEKYKNDMIARLSGSVDSGNQTFKRDYEEGGYDLSYQHNESTDAFTHADKTTEDVYSKFEETDNKQLFNRLSWFLSQDSLLENTSLIYDNNQKTFLIGSKPDILDTIPTILKVTQLDSGAFKVEVSSISSVYDANAPQVLSKDKKSLVTPTIHLTTTVTLNISSEAAKKFNDPDTSFKNAYNHEGVTFEVKFSNPSTTPEEAITHFKEAFKNDPIVLKQISDRESIVIKKQTS